MKPKTIAVLIGFGLLGIIFLQNTDVVTVQVLFWNIKMSRIVLLPFIFFMGLLLGAIGGFMTGRKRK